MAEQKTQKRLQSLTGSVSSTGGDKTIRVQVDRLVKHERYGKFVRRSTKFAAHDEQNQAKLGDVVEIVPCRRISKTKAYRLLRVIRAGNTAAMAAKGE